MEVYGYAEDFQYKDKYFYRTKRASTTYNPYVKKKAKKIIGIIKENKSIKNRYIYFL